MCTQGILERLDAGEVVVGDGGYVMQLERRGYVKAGHWTPEAAVEHPEAGTCYPLSMTLNNCFKAHFYLCMSFFVFSTKVFLCISVSAAAAQGVPEGRS